MALSNGKNWSEPDHLRPAPELRTTLDLNCEASDSERSRARFRATVTGGNPTPGRQSAGAMEARSIGQVERALADVGNNLAVHRAGRENISQVGVAVYAIEVDDVFLAVGHEFDFFALAHVDVTRSRVD